MDWVRTPVRPAVRRLRAAALALVAILTTAVVGVLVVPLAARAMVRAVMWLFQACVWVALSISAGATTWAMVGTIGRAVASALVTQQASTGLAALVLLAAVALYGLQRVLGSDGDTEDS